MDGGMLAFPGRGRLEKDPCSWSPHYLLLICSHYLHPKPVRCFPRFTSTQSSVDDDAIKSSLGKKNFTFTFDILSLCYVGQFCGSSSLCDPPRSLYEGEAQVRPDFSCCAREELAGSSRSWRDRAGMGRRLDLSGQPHGSRVVSGVWDLNRVRPAGLACTLGDLCLARNLYTFLFCIV